MGGGGADEFGRAAARAAVARALQAAGFASAARSAVDALADVLLRYLRLLGGAASAHANLAGRSAPNELDVLRFLEETAEAYQGFEGASSSTRGCLVGSGVVRDLIAFAGEADDKPLSVRRPLPRFPVRHDPSSCVSFAALGRGSGMRHVPEWLPAFPEPHTYAMAEGSGEMVGGSSAAVDEVEQVRRQRKAEKSLIGLQRQLALAGGNGIRPAMVVEDGAGKGKELDMAGIKSNPFIQSALRCGEKEVSEVAMPNLGRKHPVFDDSFAPAFAESEGERLGEGRRDQDQGRGRKRMVPKERPPVYFRIGADRKSRVMALNSRALEDRKGPWFMEDDGKRRAPSMLAEPNEKPS
ncbi:hypothetical protein ACQJBY_061938 [Aegilops geniculata]